MRAEKVVADWDCIGVGCDVFYPNPPGRGGEAETSTTKMNRREDTRKDEE